MRQNFGEVVFGADDMTWQNRNKSSFQSPLRSGISDIYGNKKVIEVSVEEREKYHCKSKFEEVLVFQKFMT